MVQYHINAQPLVHAYYDVDRDILWKSAMEEVPQLLRFLRAVVGSA
jgi:uncharacterized protein with HEPN domain